MKQTRFTVHQIIKILAKVELPGSSGKQLPRKYKELQIQILTETLKSILEKRNL